MLPLRDSVPTRRFPFVNWLLILLCAATFLFELTLGPRLESFLTAFGLAPIKYAQAGRLAAMGLTWPDFVLPLFAHMFLHGGWMHAISNLWILHIFGDNVEDALGHGRYLLFYLLCGLAAAGFQTAVSWGSPIPMIGASGAIAGVMGAYFLMFPGARVLTLVPMVFTAELVELPAVLFMGFWFFSQLYSGTVAVLGGAGSFGGTAWWAHIGGFMGGLFLVRAFLGRSGRLRR